ncbi:MAG: hypothetical protein QOF36_2510 [Microbacteriaceae bacterium]|jgi:hypothetical protein|nr:hypothetical protein [Microbacteriaceae bacterium]
MRLDRVAALAHIAYSHIYGRIPVAGKREQTRLNAALAVWRARERRRGRQPA